MLYRHVLHNFVCKDNSSNTYPSLSIGSRRQITHSRHSTLLIPQAGLLQVQKQNKQTTNNNKAPIFSLHGAHFGSSGALAHTSLINNHSLPLLPPVQGLASCSDSPTGQGILQAAGSTNQILQSSPTLRHLSSLYHLPPITRHSTVHSLVSRPWPNFLSPATLSSPGLQTLPSGFRGFLIHK